METEILEKAKQLINKFTFTGGDLIDCKKCALICVEEIQDVLYKNRMINDEWILESEADGYWEHVKNEIHKMI